jgi:hypothetical protein
MDVHKDCYSAINLTQQGGSHPRETIVQPLFGLRQTAEQTVDFLGDDNGGPLIHMRGVKPSQFGQMIIDLRPFGAIGKRLMHQRPGRLRKMRLAQISGVRQLQKVNPASPAFEICDQPPQRLGVRGHLLVEGKAAELGLGFVERGLAATR